jgi:hypothetical protein
VTRDEYVRDVGYRLSDLPWSTRRDLLTELRAHLDELPADTDLREQLGNPEAYAGDLRAAAGLERRHGVIAFLRARRPRNLILAVVALGAIGLTIGTVVWIRRYQPITFAGGTFDPVGAKGSPGSTDEYVVYHQGRPFRFGVVLQNTGRYTVRVLGVPYPSIVPFSARLLMSTPGPPSEVTTFPGKLRPFHPFDLRPGELTSLVLQGVYACHSGTGPGNSWDLSPFPVRYSFLGHTAVAEIPLGSQMAITLPKGCSLPGETP